MISNSFMSTASMSVATNDRNRSNSMMGKLPPRKVIPIEGSFIAMDDNSGTMSALGYTKNRQRNMSMIGNNVRGLYDRK